MNFLTSDLTALECYRWLASAVVPRPIAWVSTLSSTGIANLAPFSFFTIASCSPPVLMFTHVNPSDRREKDTLRNLKETGQCVINTVGVGELEAMNASCAAYPSDVSEFDALEIPSVQSLVVRPPGVAAAQVRFECSLRDIVCVSPGPSGGHLVLVDVLNIFVADSLVKGDCVDAHGLDALGKMGATVIR